MADIKVKVSRFFTDLDCILDTRMGTLLLMDPECTERVTKSGYFDRDRDLFDGINREKFKVKYQKRNKQTLGASIMTPVIGLIREYCKQVYEQNAKSPFVQEPRLVINTYPYELTDDEKHKLMIGIQYRTKIQSPIEFVHMTYSDITPMYLRNSIDQIVIYDPIEWLEVHSLNNNLKKTVCLEVTMMGPLAWRNLDFQGSMEELVKNMDLACKPFIDLQLVPLRIFSADVVPKEKVRTVPKEKTDT